MAGTLLVVVAFAHLLTVALTYPTNDKIVGGWPAALGQYPYQVSIQSLNADGSTKHFCGGSIVTPNWVVLAAHCCKGHATSNLTLAAGLLYSDLSSNGNPAVQIRRGLKNEIFFDYDINSIMYDICLIKVTEPFVFDDYVQPIALPKQMQVTPVGSLAVVSGWGATVENGPLSPELRAVQVPIISDAECEDDYYAVFYDTDPSMICAGIPEGGIDACQGDSGGPLVFNNELIGIVSWGLGCARPKLPGVYTEVAYYVDWILQKTAA